MAKDGKYIILESLLLKRLAFGTAGIRGKMGGGLNRMNELVIIQTSQGLAKYILSIHGSNLAREKGIIIGHDARHNSRSFAERAAVAFIQAGFKVFLFSDIVPTPFIPFAIQFLSSLAGIMVTASHNPKEDNGYKVYFQNGAQIIPPHDTNIQNCILEQFEPWSNAWQNDLLSQCSDPYQTITNAYFAHLQLKLVSADYIRRSKLRITFTALHGVSHKFMDRALKDIGFPHFHPVPEQMTPDPEFPTVKFPNPEEGKGVLDLSFKTADQHNSTLVLANDPDADRCAVAEKTNDRWRIFTGNELGALLGWWTWSQWKIRKVKGSTKPANCYMFSSSVSSKILASFAKKEGFNFVETLTGFKWMGNKADELIKAGKEVIFAFEEAIGFMCDPNVVKDKDGISACIFVAQMAAYLRETYNRSLSDQLAEIFKEYGFHTSNNSYFICHDKPTIDTIFAKIASPYPANIGPHKVVRVRDLNRAHDSGTSDGKPDLPCSSSSYMVTLYLENGIVCTIRTSGTEPKIKFYTEAIGQPGDLRWTSIEDSLKSVVQSMIDQLLEPQKNKLLPKPE